MKKPVSIHSPGQLTVLAVLLAGLSAPAMVYAAESTSKVVISQLYGGGGNGSATYTNDFIELFNRSGVPVSLAGMSVQYAATAGTSWTNKTDLSSVTLQPGQYYLIQENSNAAVGVALPPPDQIANIAMAVGAGKVALVSNTTVLTGANPAGGPTVLDLVGYGTANGYEGSGAAGTPSSTLSVQRAAAGCTDTDNNSGDFATAAVSPRNSATALHSCGTAPTYAVIASCPATLNITTGGSGFAPLSAADQDGIVNAVSITSAAVSGISLGALTPSSANGASASVNLNVASGTAPGSYTVAIAFANADSPAQIGSCSINVTVQGLAAVSHTIPQIQGAGATSPFAGTVQTTEGVVSAKVGSGYFIQDPLGDGDPNTSDGLFVFSSNAGVAIGDLVRVTGTVAEYTPTGATHSVTELATVTNTTVQSSGHSITPTPIVLDANLSRVEGMLVSFNNALVVNQSEFLATRGEMTLSNTRHEVPTNRYKARSAEAIAMSAANAADMIVLDDGIFVTPTVIPYINASTNVRAGDSVTNLVGVIDFGAIGGGGASYKLQPSAAPVFSSMNPRTEPPTLPDGNVKVASANVLNFFTTFTNGNNITGTTGQGCPPYTANKPITDNCRGADNLTEFVRQRDKIVNELKALDADVVGLMEIQNNGDFAVSYLVDQLNAAIGATTYAYVPKPADTGTDAIRVAMIYKPAKLTMVGGALSDGDAVNNRPPFAQTFKVSNGGKFSLIVNHFKSKGSCPSGSGSNSDLGDGQGCWNANRILQANRLSSFFIPQVIANAGGDPDVLVIGDLNSHGMEDPIIALNNAGLSNQLERFIRAAGVFPYSFVFDGESGYLDHALATSSLAPQVIGAAEWHNNADESPAIDYNLDGKPNDLYVNNQYRASDHDPVIVSLALTGSYADMTSSFTVTRSGITMNRVTSKYTGTLTFTNTSPAAISGPFQVRLDGLPAGVTLDNKSGDNTGAPYVTVSNASLAPGEKVTITTTFSNPSKVGIGYTTTIFTGNF